MGLIVQGLIPLVLAVLWQLVFVVLLVLVELAVVVQPVQPDLPVVAAAVAADWCLVAGHLQPAYHAWLLSSWQTTGITQGL